MSEFDATFERLIQLMIDKRIPMSVSVGVVSDIDKTNDTCNVTIDDDQVLHSVRLRSVVDGDDNKMVVYPADKSSVITILVENDVTEAYLLACSKIESAVVKIENQSLKVDKDGFVFNDGNNNGLIKISDLVTKLNDLVTKYNAHTHITTATVGSSATPGTIAATTDKANSFNKDDFEDTKIKH